MPPAPRPAVAVVALVRERRLDLVHQVAVRHVQLDHVEADAGRPQRGVDEGLLHAGEVVLLHGAGRVPALGEGDGRGGDGLPRVLVAPERLAALPGALGRGLAAGMGDLDAELRAGQRHGLRGSQRARHGPLVGVAIEAEVSHG